MACSIIACGRTSEPAAESGEQGDENAISDRTTIVAKTAEEVGIRTARIGPGVIRDVHEVQGLLTPIENRHAHIRARFPGPLKAVLVGVGDEVKAGQALAKIESNVSLAEYTVSAPFSGTVLDLRASVGELAGDEPLFEIADLSSLWVDLHLFGEDAQHISVGLPVEVIRLSDSAIARTRLGRILPGTATASQSTIARATILNEDRRWRPGTAVRARVTVSERPAKLVVPIAALQKMDNQSVVFVKDGDTYISRPVKTGEQDGLNAEILDGLTPGAEIVVEQSYLIKADIEKAGAAHED
jgi:cobalt-zinc-cadmium efflux system membrane fusion protein